MSEKVCSKCGFELKEEQLFCTHCGTKYKEEKKIKEEKKRKNKGKRSTSNKRGDLDFKQRVCLNCGNVLKSDARFCTFCGTKYEDVKQESLTPSDTEKKEDSTSLEEDVSKEDATEGKVCAQCGNLLVENTLFCTHCGMRVNKEEKELKKMKPCPQCKSQVDVHEKVCPTCGKRLKKDSFINILIVFLLLSLLVGGIFLAYERGFFDFDKDDTDYEEGVVSLKMPDVLGKMVDEAKDELEEIGLQVVIEYEATSDSSLVGIVFEQSIDKNEVVQDGQEVTIKVYAKDDYVSVISVVGLSKEEATTKLEKLGLKVQYEEQYSNTVAIDIVISQDQLEGKKLLKGEIVTLTISLGKNNSSIENDGNSNSYEDTESSGNVSNSWSNWVSSLPSGVNSSKYTIQTKTEYRYKTKSTTTSKEPSLSGWTLVSQNSTPVYSSIVAEVVLPFSTYNNEYRNNEKYQIVSAAAKPQQWHIKTLHCHTYNGNQQSITMPVGGQCSTSNSVPDYHEYTVDRLYNVGDIIQDTYCSSSSKNSKFMVVSIEEEYVVRYKMLSGYNTTYVYEKWSDWSNWSENPRTSNDTTLVETRTLYRYRLK